MTDTRAIVRGLGSAAAVLGTLAFVVGAPVRATPATRETMVSAATRDALDCVEDDGGRVAAPPPLGPAAPRSSSRASEASRGICTSLPRTSAVNEAVSALQLAQWIRDGRPGLRVLDLRDSSAFEARHIPSAEWFEPIGMPKVLPSPSETLVLYSDDDLRDAQGAAWLAAVGHARVYVVRNGMAAWMTEVIDPVVHGDSAATIAALSRYFGGVPRAEPARIDPGVTRTTRTTRTMPEVQPRGAMDEFGFVARRGC